MQLLKLNNLCFNKMEAQAVQTSLNVLAATDFFLKISETVL